MKITFFCGSLESGRDGVGDYSRALAGECLRQGCACSLVALHDRHAREMEESEINTAAGNIPVLRMPASIPWAERTKRAVAFRERFKPDWISLQFVSYGFQDKGMVWNLRDALRAIVGECPVEIMFHELWIGASTNANLKEQLIGKLQRHFIRKLFGELRPRCAHTSNSAYLELLSRAGISAQLLPLFGSIPVAIERNDSWFVDTLRMQGLDISEENRSAFWLFILFGALHSVWPAEPLFSYLREAAAANGRKIVILAAGRMGTSGEKLWASLAARYLDAFLFCRLGERTPCQISDCFRSADFGIATTPWALIGKSGTVAAMLESGLPVIVNRDDCRFPFQTEDSLCSPLLCKMDADLVSRLPTLKRQPARSTLPAIARQFVNSLQGRTTAGRAGVSAF